MEDIIFASAASLARAIAAKDVSSAEVVATYLRRIDEVNPRLNAVVQLRAEAALQEAREADDALARGEVKGPLHGVPVTIKDAIEAEGMICTGGTMGRAAFVPQEDATVVARLRAAGAIVLGKTNVPEMSLAFESDNLIYGQTKNPYDLSRTPGGSSGGEAAIIAAGGSPMGLGSDSAGSVRLPAHYCGLAGLKPTVRRVPRTGHFPPAHWLFDETWHIGPLARRVEDLILTLPIISGPDGRDPSIVPMPLGDAGAVDLKSLRVASFAENGIVAPSSETVNAVRAAAKSLAAAGLTVDEARPGCVEQTFDLWMATRTADGGAELRHALELAGTTEFHPLMQRLLEGRGPDDAIPSADLGRLVMKLNEYRAEMITFMRDYDVMLSPVNAYPALAHGATQGESKSYSYTIMHNLTGWPVAVVRCGSSPEGLPIGVQVAAAPAREEIALAVALHLEAELGGWQPPPL